MISDGTTEPAAGSTVPAAIPPERPPLWLPEGSVRAMLAISVIGAVVYMSVMGLPESETLKTMAGIAFGFYFGVRLGK